MMNLKDIYEGWKAYMVSDSVALEVAKQRAKICIECQDDQGRPVPKNGLFETILPDYSIKEIQGLKCSVCNCPLSTATRSKNYTCPKEKW